MNVPDWLRAAREQWTYTGVERPPFAVEPKSGQESVWDYPRPPAISPDGRMIEITGSSGNLARSTSSIRVMETSLPPSFYLPPDDIVSGTLTVSAQRSHCEWKGDAEYLANSSGEIVGWRYPRPYEFFAAYAGWVSFYPDRVECRVNGENVRAQNSNFYGGWITNELVGPFKGDPEVPAL